MDILHFALVALIAVLISAFLEPVIPRVSLPLVQMVIGLALALFSPGPAASTLDPELFLVLFIAPLLYDETQHVDLKALWRSRAPILSLAVGLVVVTMVVVGFALHGMLPTVPLACALALGAAVAPTDAAAVSALSKDVSITKRQDGILAGESLMNDASGVVAFQTAIAVALTGAFSPWEATLDFTWAFVGGIALGAVLGLCGWWIMGAIRQSKSQDATVHIVSEVLMPFVVFLLGEQVHVSGILAVVAAGIVQRLLPEALSPSDPQVTLASKPVWQFITFTINGVVFVLLGMELPAAFTPSWTSPAISNGLLISAGLVVALTVVAVRFLWILALEALRKREGKSRRGLTRGALRDTLVMTLAGPKGAITLSMAYTIPLLAADGSPFPERNTLIFMASAVVVVTLLAANFTVPLIAPADEEDEGFIHEMDEGRLKMLLRVVKLLSQAPKSENPHSPQAVGRRFVLRSYGERIARARSRAVDPEVLLETRIRVLEGQRASLQERRDGGDLSPEVADRLDRHFGDIEERLERGSRHPFGKNPRHPLRPLPSSLRILWYSLRGKTSGDSFDQELHRTLRQCEELALDLCEAMADDGDPRVRRAAALLARDHRLNLHTMEMADLDGEEFGLGAPFTANGAFGEARKREEDPHIPDDVDPKALGREIRDLTAEGHRLELQEIAALVEEGSLSRAAAHELTEEVYLLQMAL